MPLVWPAFVSFSVWHTCLSTIFKHYLHNPHIIHYLDDSPTFLTTFTAIEELCDSLGVVTKEEKCISPATVITFLGININTVAQTLPLPPDKLTALLHKLQAFSRLQRCTKRATAWGAHWAWKRLLIHCDNQAVVHVWPAGTTKHRSFTRLVQALFYVAASHNFTVLLQHISGVDNGIADALSHLQFHRFRCLAPDADPEPTSIPVIVTHT